MPALKGIKRSAAASNRHAGHSHLLLSAFEAAVCAPSNLKPSAAPSTGSFDQARRPQPSATIGVRGCRLPALQRPKTLRGSLDRQLRPGTQATAICYYRRSRLPFARPQRPKTLRSSFDHGTQATTICYYRRSRLPCARPQRPKTLRGSFDQSGSQATAICYYRHSRLPFARPQRPKTFRSSFDQALRPQPSATIGIRGCRLPALKCLKRSAAPSTRHSGGNLRVKPNSSNFGGRAVF